ncbi:Vacuolar sorting-associated protein 53 [Gossypium arboreum]|uniref:Vacuolar sorting-associated protein 53 n=1 Tax=Gossypium arboreum TaxID=29729 RepID=A0A0B0NGJ8_GOSAR|nr:Vacuolar sorting-associated protein 53 [Gossypium arboreum]
MEKSMLKAELSKEMRTSPTVEPSDCGNDKAPINYQRLFVSKIIDSQFADQVDMSEVQETKFDAEMAAMTCVPWGTLESVGDQSGYVNGINMILSSSIPVLGSILSPIYFQFFLASLHHRLAPNST